MGIRAFALAAACLGAMPSCLDPTEISITIESDSCASLSDVEVFVGDTTSPSAVAPTSACKGTRVGTIVLVPSGKGGSISLRVRAAEKMGGSCTDVPTHGCVEVQRNLQFLPHARLPITIKLDSACIDADCGGQTCVGGMCVECPDCVHDAGADVSIARDAGTDGGVVLTCKPPWFNMPVTATVWHFQEPAGPNMMISDEAKTCFGTAQLAVTSSGCGNTAVLGSGGTLGCDANAIASSIDFHVAFRVASLTSTTSGTLVAKSAPGWKITIDHLQLGFQVTNGTTVSQATIGTPISVNAWHSVEVRVANGILDGAWIDGAMVKVSAPLTVFESVKPPITIGTTVNCKLDELYIFR